MTKHKNLTAYGFTLGSLSVVFAVALGFAFLLSLIRLTPLLVVAAITFVATLVGFAFSASDLLRRRRAGRGIIPPILSIGLSSVAIGLLALVALFALSTREPTLDEAAQRLTAEGLSVHTVGTSRPALLILPTSHDPQTPLPLILNLHGYGGHAPGQDDYFGLSPLVNSHNFALLLPNGLRDDNGRRFWNAADLCCGEIDSKPDDVAYLHGLVQEVATRVRIDRVLVAGMSNGGWMGYRLACESFPGLAAFVVVNGSSFADPTRCESAHPVSILHLHATDDEVVPIAGGLVPHLGPGQIPAARELVQQWAGRAECDPARAETLDRVDISPDVAGAETTVTRYRAGCREGVTVEYWEMNSITHGPTLAPDFGQRIVTWMFDATR